MRTKELFGLLLWSTFGSLQAFAQVSYLHSDTQNAAWTVMPEEEVGKDIGPLIQNGYQHPKAVKAIVPGTVFTSYVTAGLEKDPNFGDNIQKVDRKKYDRSFWYRTEFKIPADFDKEIIWLNFDGINRKGQIYLNGNHLGDLDGFMHRGHFNVTQLVDRNGSNTLAVLVDIPRTPLANQGSPNYLSSGGWDWMPYVPGLNSGITDKVWLENTGKSTITDPWMRSKLVSRSLAELTLQTEITNNGDAQSKTTVKGTITPGNITFSQEVDLQAGETKTVKFDKRYFPQMVVNNPKLWWPNGYGEPHLYTCRLEVIHEGKTSETEEFRFGIRQYSYDKKDGIFHLYINGVPVFVKGSDWGMSEYMLRSNPEHIRTWVKLNQEMNFNMIRNWLGSVTEKQFYESCDELGIMVWDDFWINSNPNLPYDLNVFNNNMMEKIKRFRNHACIAVWCGDNEGTPEPPLTGWMAENIRTFDGGDRHFQPCSNNGGLSGSGPWDAKDQRWYFTAYPDCKSGSGFTRGWGFRTEIGSAVFTNYESYKKFMPEPERWPASPEMLDKHFFGNSAGNARPTRYFAAVEYNYGKAAGTEDFCRKAQLLNIEVNKAMYEGWQHHLWNDASGILTWMSQSAYPSFVWQTYDYYYDLNGAYWGVRKACEPLHIQWSYADNTVKVVNASGEAYNGLRATAAVYNMDGSEVKRYAQRAALSSLPNTAVKVMTLPFPEDRNLARGKKTVASSSENDDSHAAKSVTDGNTGSSWRSGGPGEQWVMVDLGAPTEFSDIVLTWESEAAKAYEILASDDASTWRTVYTSGKPSTPIDQIRIDPVTARYVKLQGTAPHDDWQLVLFEMELYGPETPAEELSPVHFIRLRLTDDAGNLLSENFYWRSNRLGDYRALNDLEPAKLDVRTKAETVDGKRIIRATVTNRGRSVAFAVRLMPVYASTGEQILPVIMDDNYFTLLRGETRKVDIEIDESLLGDDTYKLVARPYND